MAPRQKFTLAKLLFVTLVRFAFAQQVDGSTRRGATPTAEHNAKLKQIQQALQEQGLDRWLINRAWNQSHR